MESSPGSRYLAELAARILERKRATNYPAWGLISIPRSLAGERAEDGEGT
jgi:hypothetical protein